MSDDILDRLRFLVQLPTGGKHLVIPREMLREAADLIEKLRAENKRLREILDNQPDGLFGD
jgi:hypothetical protein